MLILVGCDSSSLIWSRLNTIEGITKLTFINRNTIYDVRKLQNFPSLSSGDFIRGLSLECLGIT